MVKRRVTTAEKHISGFDQHTLLGSPVGKATRIQPVRPAHPEASAAEMRCRLREQPMTFKRLLQGATAPGKMPPQPPDLRVVLP